MLNLPEKREFGWKMKPLTSAVTNFGISKQGVYHLHITHDLVRGITPAMLYWWFTHIGGDMEYDGASYPKYLVWHPYDHIFWKLVRPAANGKIGPGALFRIVECFGRNPKHSIDSTEEVTKLDYSGIRLSVKKFGMEIYSLEHQFIRKGQDTLYVSDMTVGSDNLFGRLIFNPLIRPFIFTEKMGFAWLKHNIEEVGNFEYFLPELYEQQKANTAEHALPGG